MDLEIPYCSCDADAVDAELLMLLQLEGSFVVESWVAAAAVAAEIDVCVVHSADVHCFAEAPSCCCSLFVVADWEGQNLVPTVPSEDASELVELDVGPFVVPE